MVPYFGQAYINEKAAPELLQYAQELVDSTQKNIFEQVSMMKAQHNLVDRMQAKDKKYFAADSSTAARYWIGTLWRRRRYWMSGRATERRIWLRASSGLNSNEVSCHTTRVSCPFCAQALANACSV